MDHLPKKVRDASRLTGVADLGAGHHSMGFTGYAVSRPVVRRPSARVSGGFTAEVGEQDDGRVGGGAGVVPTPDEAGGVGVAQGASGDAVAAVLWSAIAVIVAATAVAVGTAAHRTEQNTDLSE